jgi:hypothetical protein
MRQSVALARRRAQMERACLAPKAAPVKVVATVPAVVAAAPAAGGTADLSKLPDLKVVQNGRAIDAPWGRLAGLAAIWAAGQTREWET